MAFKPLHETHAIERVSFAFGLEREVTESELRLIADRYKELSHDFGRAELIEGVEMSISPGADGSPTAEMRRPSVGGVRLKTFRRDGNVEWELGAGKAIDSATLGISCYAYTRWVAIWGKARAIFGAVLVALNSPGIKWAGLDYLDVFTWEGEERDWHAEKLFKMDSGLIATAMTDKGPIWHTHQGWFAKGDLAVPGDRLEILNIDGVHRDGKFKVMIGTRMKHNFQDIQSSEGVNEGGAVNASMEQMHDEDKRLLDTLLKPELIEAIYLHAESDQ